MVRKRQNEGKKWAVENTSSLLLRVIVGIKWQFICKQLSIVIGADHRTKHTKFHEPVESVFNNTSLISSRLPFLLGPGGTLKSL